MPVHVWWTSDILRFAALGTHLDLEELQRVARLRRPVDRRRLRARRGLLRTVLAGFLDAEPASLSFVYGRYGKPSLARAHHELEFSIAHSGNAAMLAVCRSHPVGVDVERLRPDLDVEALVSTTCTPRERAALTALPTARVRDAFYTLWVHKEAVAKADGRGLSLAPTDIEVGSALDRGHADVVVPDATEHLVGPGSTNFFSARIWRTRTLSVTPGLAAAIAAPDSNANITLRQIQTIGDVRSLLRAV